MRKLVVSLFILMGCLSFVNVPSASAGLWAVKMNVTSVYCSEVDGTNNVVVYMSWNDGANTRKFNLKSTLSTTARNQIVASLLSAQANSATVQVDVDNTNHLVGVFVNAPGN
jgi:ABC-type uncharacterized transport system YnjBCD substrate-binding protein